MQADNKIVLPQNFNYAEAYLTLRCNFKCGYCINDRDGVDRKREELPSWQWTKALNNIDFKDIPLTLGGGEPTLHRGFYQILQDLKPETKVDLLTNLTFDVDKFMSNVLPQRFTTPTKPFYHPIRVSFHPGQTDIESTIKKASHLQDKGFSVGIFGLAHPYHINDNMEMAWKCNKVGVPFYTKDFLGEVDGRMYGFFKYPEGLDGIVKNVLCKTRELLIDPEGDVYRCHRDLYHKNGTVGNITHDGFEVRDMFRPCENYGNCNPCDIKLKTNRFLGGVECQVNVLDRPCCGHE